MGAVAVVRGLAVVRVVAIPVARRRTLRTGARLRIPRIRSTLTMLGNTGYIPTAGAEVAVATYSNCQ